mmetsp:Transcript_112087/g.317448  ORF Transcript_112087/g.317448 Transcript_112087/m.317448 type:complete len:213 (-) Transcript_112087:255-893(-)
MVSSSPARTSRVVLTLMQPSAPFHTQLALFKPAQLWLKNDIRWKRPSAGTGGRAAMSTIWKPLREIRPAASSRRSANHSAISSCLRLSSPAGVLGTANAGHWHSPPPSDATACRRCSAVRWASSEGSIRSSEQPPQSSPNLCFSLSGRGHTPGGRGRGHSPSARQCTAMQYCQAQAVLTLWSSCRRAATHGGSWLGNTIAIGGSVKMTSPLV